MEFGKMERINTPKNIPQKIDAALLDKTTQVRKLQKIVLKKLEDASNSLSSPVAQKYIGKIVKNFNTIKDQKQLIAIATITDAMIKYNSDKLYLVKNQSLEKNIVLAAQILKLPSEALLSLTACSAPMQSTEQTIQTMVDSGEFIPNKKNIEFKIEKGFDEIVTIKDEKGTVFSVRINEQNNLMELKPGKYTIDVPGVGVGVFAVNDNMSEMDLRKRKPPESSKISDPDERYRKQVEEYIKSQTG